MSIIRAKIECHGEIHELRRNDEGGYDGGCAETLDDQVYLCDLADAPYVGCQGIVRLDGAPTFEGSGMIMWVDGSVDYYEHGRLHRADGPAVVDANGNEYWYWRGSIHRTDGPAVVNHNGWKEWVVHGKLHRTDGPAIIKTDGTKVWWWEGRSVTEEEHQREVHKARA